MILDTEITIKRKNNSNLEYYKSLGYETDLDEFKINISDLLKNSNIHIRVSCDYCSIIETIPFIKWNRSMESIVKKYACKSCKGKKIKESNLINYGVTSVAKLEVSKKKSKETCLKKYGFDIASKSDVIKLKTMTSNIEKWGVDSPLKNEKIKEKSKKTLLENWGVDNISKSEKIKKIKKSTCLKNWGVESPLHSNEIKEKLKRTNKEKYGSDYFTKTEIYRKNNYKIANDNFYLEYLDKGISLFNCDCNGNHKFEITKDVYSKRKEYNIDLCTICNPVNDNKSLKEKKMYDYIKAICDLEVINGFKDGKMEIDIYIPELKIGFEFNGLYWHSNLFKEKNFHKNKSEYFQEKGIRIIHIWEDDWDNKRNIIESQIRNLLKKGENRISARNCQVRVINCVKTCRSFLDKNHIQGYVNSNLKLGLFLKEELIGIMTFDHFEGRKKMQSDSWNLNRFCIKTGFSVVGGASKLFSYFLKNIKPKKVISYADLDWSRGDIYYKLGFNLEHQLEPDYKYIIDNKRINKSNFRKSRIGISESKLRILKIWNCGKLKFNLQLN